MVGEDGPPVNSKESSTVYVSISAYPSGGLLVCQLTVKNQEMAPVAEIAPV